MAVFAVGDDNVGYEHLLNAATQCRDVCRWVMEGEREVFEWWPAAVVDARMQLKRAWAQNSQSLQECVEKESPRRRIEA